jgi:hypothetical protein
MWLEKLAIQYDGGLLELVKHFPETMESIEDATSHGAYYQPPVVSATEAALRMMYAKGQAKGDSYCSLPRSKKGTAAAREKDIWRRCHVTEGTSDDFKSLLDEVGRERLDEDEFENKLFWDKVVDVIHTTLRGVYECISKIDKRFETQAGTRLLDMTAPSSFRKSKIGLLQRIMHQRFDLANSGA